MGSAQINSDGAGGQGLNMAYTTPFTRFAIYLRVQPTTTSSTFQVYLDIESSGNTSQSFVYYDTAGIAFNNNSTDTYIIPVASVGTWYDVLIVRRGSVCDLWGKPAALSQWKLGGSPASPSFTPANIYCGRKPSAEASANRSPRIGKMVIFDQLIDAQSGMLESTARSLQNSQSVIFYNDWSDATNVQNDQGPRGSTWTVVGTPAANENDPAFASPLSALYGGML